MVTFIGKIPKEIREQTPAGMTPYDYYKYVLGEEKRAKLLEREKAFRKGEVTTIQEYPEPTKLGSPTDIITPTQEPKVSTSPFSQAGTYLVNGEFKSYKAGTAPTNAIYVPPKVTKLPPTTSIVLPYQKSGTSYYEPTKGYYVEPTQVEVQGKPESFISFAGKAIEAPRKLVESALSRERLEKEEENKLFTYAPTKSKYPKMETSTYAPKPLSALGEMKKERIVTEAIQQEKVSIIANDKFNQIIESETSKLNIKIQNAKSQDEINKLISEAKSNVNKKIKSEIKILENKYISEATERDKERLSQLKDKQFQEQFLENRIRDIATFGLYSIPYYGTTLFAKDIASQVSKPSATISSFIQYPKESAASLITFGVLGKASGKLKSIRKEAKISEALSKAEIEIKPKGFVKEYELGAYKLTKEGELQLKSLLKEGKSIREADIDIIPKQGYEQYTPKIKGKILEVVNERGEIIDRIFGGDIQAQLGRKKVSSNILGETISKVNKETGTIESYSEVLTTIRKKPLIEFGLIKYPKDRETLSRFYEETKQTGFKEEKGKRLLRAETTSRLLSLEKYKAGDFFGKYEISNPSELRRAGKPYSKSEMIEAQKLEKTRGIKFGETEGLLVGERLFETSGFGVSKRIKEVSKKKPKGKGFSFLEEKKKIEPEEYISLFHGTTEQAGKRIIEKGAKDIYVTEPSYAEGFAGRSVAKGGFKEKPFILEVRMPKSEFEKSIIKREVGKGGVPEVILKSVEPKYIKEYKKIEKEPEIVSDLIAPSYIQGGQVGIQVKSKYEGESFLIPYAGEEFIYGFKKELPRELSRGTLTEELIYGRGTIRERTIQTPLISFGLSNRERNKLGDFSLTSDIQKPKEREIESFASGLFNLQLFKQPQSELQKQKLELRQPSIRPKPTTPRIPKPTFEFIYPEEFRFKFGETEEKKKLKEKQVGYNAFAYIDAVKPNKAYWKQLNEKPLTQKSALSKVAEFVDNTISARGKITKSTSKEKPIDTREDYFGVNKYKFRQFQQKKGVRTKLPNQIIELQKYRLDKLGETRNIQSSRISKFFGF